MFCSKPADKQQVLTHMSQKNKRKTKKSKKTKKKRKERKSIMFCIVNKPFKVSQFLSIYSGACQSFLFLFCKNSIAYFYPSFQEPVSLFIPILINQSVNNFRCQYPVAIIKSPLSNRLTGKRKKKKENIKKEKRKKKK